MKKPALVLLLALLSGCGFHPLVGRSSVGDAADELARIRVSLIENRSGQMLRNQLTQDLAPRGDAVGSRYTLEVRLQEPRQEIALNRDESASRIAYTANATFSLRDNQGRSLFGGSSSSSSTFEATNSEFAAISGQLGARDRAIQELSADIRQQLAAYFGRAARGLTPSPN